jgi:hypothetical protein
MFARKVPSSLNSSAPPKPSRTFLGKPVPNEAPTNAHISRKDSYLTSNQQYSPKSTGRQCLLSPGRPRIEPWYGSWSKGLPNNCFRFRLAARLSLISSFTTRPFLEESITGNDVHRNSDPAEAPLSVRGGSPDPSARPKAEVGGSTSAFWGAGGGAEVSHARGVESAFAVYIYAVNVPSHTVAVQIHTLNVHINTLDVKSVRYAVRKGPDAFRRLEALQALSGAGQHHNRLERFISCKQ